MKSLVLIFLATSLAISFNVQAEEQEELWDIGAGLRVNYLRLTGGFSGYSAKNDSTYDLDYKDIGMSNYAPSVALALGGKYGKFNLFFGASRGTYTGSFTTKQDITIKDETIAAGSRVDGEINMGIYSLSTTYAFLKEPKHDVGVGFGLLILDQGIEFKTSDVKLGDSQVYPMPFLAISGRKKFGKFRISAVGGGAYFDGELDDLDYTVYYITTDIKGSYEFYKKNNYTGIVSLGYRYLLMDSKANLDDGSWFQEKDNYSGPFLSVLVKYTEFSKK